MAFYQGVRDNYNALRMELDAIEAVYTQNRAAFDDLKAMTPNERVEWRIGSGNLKTQHIESSKR